MWGFAAFPICSLKINPEILNELFHNESKNWAYTRSLTCRLLPAESKGQHWEQQAACRTCGLPGSRWSILGDRIRGNTRQKQVALINVKSRTISSVLIYRKKPCNFSQISVWGAEEKLWWLYCVFSLHFYNNKILLREISLNHQILSVSQCLPCARFQVGERALSDKVCDIGNVHP